MSLYDSVRDLPLLIEGYALGGLELQVSSGFLRKSTVIRLEGSGEEGVGVQIVRRSLEEPIRQIAANAGAEGSVVVERVKTLEPGMGFNALTGAYENMIKAGIIDPTKVTRSALQNAASIAAMLLTTETLITDKPKKEERTPQAPPMDY